MRKITENKISIYIPHDKMDENLVPRLIRLAVIGERSINWLVLCAIREYLEKEENDLEREGL